MSVTASLMPARTSDGFSPRRISTIPETPGGCWFKAKTPVGIAVPIATFATSRMKTGTPLFSLTTIASMSGMF